MAGIVGISRVSGLPSVLRNLRNANDRIGRGVQRGLVQGGRFLLRESHKIVPVDTGVLRASSDVRNVGGSGTKADIVVFYNTEYAVYVHEDLTKKHGQAYNEAYGAEGEKLRGPDQQAKFLEKPAREKRQEILKIVVAEARKAR